MAVDRDDNGKKNINVDRIFRNMTSQGGRAALARRLEFSVRSRNISLLSITLIISGIAGILCLLSMLGIYYFEPIFDHQEVNFFRPGKHSTHDVESPNTIRKTRVLGEPVLAQLLKGVDISQVSKTNVITDDLPTGDTLVNPLAVPVATEVNSLAVPVADDKREFTPKSGHLHGIIGIGPDGNPTWVPNPIRFKMTTEQKKVAHKGYCFNTKVSESIELDRSIPEYNSWTCQRKKYNLSELPKSSVVIVFHDENLSALLRSAHSVLNRTPPELLEELLLVDDNSNPETHPWLQGELDSHVQYLPKTTVIRLETRHGLMRARMAGVYAAKGEVVVFLDSHIECANRWLEPMVQQVKDNPKTVSIPLIHTIDFDSFAFESGFLSVLGFTWSLGQTHPYRPMSDSEPMPSPVMAGGLFSINREWFLELGGYDEEMRLYGGEEMEIGFKTWMCGGRLEANPCSRVGHVFRSSTYWTGQVYKVPGEEIHRNKLRVAENWMDEYKVIAKLAIPELPDTMELGPLDKVRKIREKLDCKSFNWYLTNVFPELYIPDLTKSLNGCIQSEAMLACVDTLLEKAAGSTIGAYPCHFGHGTQAFLLDHNNNLRIAEGNFETCLNIHNDKVVIGKCEQPLVYDNETHTISYGDVCLQVTRLTTVKSPYTLSTASCNPADINQKFTWPEMANSNLE